MKIDFSQSRDLENLLELMGAGSLSYLEDAWMRRGRSVFDLDEALRQGVQIKRTLGSSGVWSYSLRHHEIPDRKKTWKTPVKAKTHTELKTNIEEQIEQLVEFIMITFKHKEWTCGGILKKVQTMEGAPKFAQRKIEQLVQELVTASRVELVREAKNKWNKISKHYRFV